MSVPGCLFTPICHFRPSRSRGNRSRDRSLARSRVFISPLFLVSLSFYIALLFPMRLSFPFSSRLAAPLALPAIDQSSRPRFPTRRRRGAARRGAARRVDANGSAAAAECDITDFAINAGTRADDFPQRAPGVTTAMQIFIRGSRTRAA